MYKIADKVQVLDRTCFVWRNATIKDIKNNDYVIHFDNYLNKYDSEYTIGTVL